MLGPTRPFSLRLPDIDDSGRLACHDLVQEEVGEQEVAEVVGAHVDLEAVFSSAERLESDSCRKGQQGPAG